MHGRLKGPISQLSLPSAKGCALVCPQIVGQKGENKTKHSQKAKHSNSNNDNHTHPFKASLLQLQTKWTLSLQILQNQISEQTTADSGQTAFAKDYHIPWHSGGKQGKQEGRQGKQSIRAWEGPTARDSWRGVSKSTREKEYGVKSTHN